MTTRRWGVGRRLVMVVSAVALVFGTELGGVAQASGPRQDLNGTWQASDGTTWIFTGSPGGGGSGYRADYRGVGAHSKLTGVTEGFFDGAVYSGQIHIEEPNQVEGGDPTVVEGTFSFKLDPSYRPPVLEGDIVGGNRTFHERLSCTSGGCRDEPCTFVNRSEDHESTPDEQDVAEDLRFLLTTRFIDAPDCTVTFGNRHGGFTARLNTETVGRTLDTWRRTLEREFPDAPEAVRTSIAKAISVAADLAPLQVGDGQPAFAGVRSLVDSGTISLLAATALKPPGNQKAADALADVIRLAALNDAGEGGT